MFLSDGEFEGAGIVSILGMGDEDLSCVLDPVLVLLDAACPEVS